MSDATEHPTLREKFWLLVLGNPLVPLILLLLGLVLVLEILQPGIVSARWLGNTIKFAIPLAMLAACQTATMLTGGIDLSVGITATITSFVTATLTPQLGAPAAFSLHWPVHCLSG